MIDENDPIVDGNGGDIMVPRVEVIAEMAKHRRKHFRSGWILGFLWGAMLALLLTLVMFRVTDTIIKMELIRSGQISK